jgi:hypothetical protein
VRLSTIHQFVIGGAATGAGLVCLYAAVLARAGRGSSWALLSVAAGGCGLALAFYLRRFRHTHPPPGRTP